MRISVVIPVRNEEDSIRPLLDSLLRQTVKPDEIIIADGGSTDATTSIISEYADNGAPINLVRGGPGLPGRNRNLAATQVTNDWIAFVDAGTRPGPTWLESLAAQVRNRNDVDVVYGSYEPVTDTFFKECATIAYVPPPVKVGSELMRPRSIVSTLMRKSVWQAVRGFPEDLRSAEDLLFLNKVEAARFRIAYAPQAIVRWNLQPTLGKTFTRFVTYSYNNIRAGLWHSWQSKIFRRYGLLLVLAVPAFFFGFLWLLLPAISWLLMLIIRAMAAIVRNGKGYPAPWTRNLLRLSVLVPLLAVIDLATMVGSLHWLLKDRSYFKNESSGVSNDA